ncbi:MAG TPA: copper resistance protein CopC [Glycomyces sp.]|nr:copper resistance protein CopC [Glycomyces sp.]
MTRLRMRPLGRAFPLALAALFTALAFALAPAAPAQAHAALLATDPADRAALDTAPDAVTLTFNESVQPVEEAMRLVDGNGEERSVPAAVSDADVVVDLPDDLPDGPYYLNWRVISADSHPISGVLSFTVGTGTAPPPPSEAAEAAPDRPWAVWAVNIAQYAGLLLFAGYALFRTAVARELAPPRPRHRLLNASGALAVLAAALAVPVGALDLAGQPLDRIGDLDAWRGTVQTGALAALAATVIGVALVRLGVGRARGAPAVLAGGAAALAAPILIGHTVAFGPRWLMVAADAVHLATAAIWIGGIAGLTVVLTRRRRGPDGAADAAAVVARFSTWAGYSVAALGASGIAMAWAIHREWASLFASDHGRALLVKLGLVALALALAGWNRYRLVPAIRADRDAPAALARLRRTVGGEAAVLAAVVALTGVLVNLPPGDDRAAPDAGETAAADSGPLALQAPLGDGEAQLHLTSGAAGEHTLTLALVDAAGAPLAPLEAPVVTATLPERDFGPVEALIHEYGPGQYHCMVDLPLTGTWELTVQVRASEFQSHSAAFEFPIG